MNDGTAVKSISLVDVINELGLQDAGAAPVDQKMVSGAYSSDLLSDVMGFAHPGDIWVTVQCHMNLVAVATLKELAAVVVCGGREIDQPVIQKARDEDVALLVSPDTAFEVCGKLWEMGIRRSG